MSAIIHHGGAGTTSAALTAGVPSIAIPFFSDQPFWGRQIYTIGVGLPPIKKQDLSTYTLIRILRELTSNQKLKAKAARLGNQLEKEKGARKAAHLIDEYLTRH